VRRAIAAIGVALVLSAAPSRLRAQTIAWSDGTTESVVTIDSGQLHYRKSKPLPGNTGAWWEYTIWLSDIECVQFERPKTGDVLAIYGKSTDSVLKKADSDGTARRYEISLRHVEIDFTPQAASNAEAILRELTSAAPDLAKRINKGMCAA
jgi:hypothetical protein